jgi:hypothetical protein
MRTDDAYTLDVAEVARSLCRARKNTPFPGGNEWVRTTMPIDGFPFTVVAVFDIQSRTAFALTVTPFNLTSTARSAARARTVFALAEDACRDITQHAPLSGASTPRGAV